MVVLNVTVNNCTPQTIVIGRRGTYDTIQIAFDLSFLIKNYGSGTAVLAIKRSQDESAYPAIITQEDATLLWTVNETDTAYVGSGECQLMWYVDGGLAKTIIYPIVVMRDILATSEEAPDAYQEWVDALIAEGAETLQNAQNAAQSASDAEDAKVDAVTAKEAAEAAQEAAETAVTHYPKIENNYWMVWDSTSQSYVSTGIQAEGEDGYSPEVTITSITGGHRVTITDKDHPQGQSFDVMDGQGGGGTSDYTDLTNKPSINNVTLTGNKTAADLGLATPSDIPTNAGDIEFDDQETYAAGSVGAELSSQSNAIDQKQTAPQTAGTAGQVLGLDANLDPVWVDQSGGGVSSVNGKTGAVTLNASDVGAGTYSKPSGGIPASDLASAVQASIGKADSAYQKPVGGIPATDLASAVQTSLGKADTALQTAPVSSVAGKTGAVTLDAGDVEFDDSETYATGSIGAEVSQQKNAIDHKQDATNYVTLSGTIVTQTGADNTMYLCGELAELTFTAPATGQTAIRFSSGTTPTVATFSGVTWLNGFDPTAIEASKTYEINILNGLGCAAWT